jgi:hypothetical protein
MHRLDPAYPLLRDSLQRVAAPATYGGIHCFISGGHLTSVRRIVKNSTGPLLADPERPLSGPQEAAAASLLLQCAAVGDGEVVIPIADGVPSLAFCYDEALPLRRALLKAAALGTDGAIRCAVKAGAITAVRLAYESTTGSTTVDDAAPLTPLQERALLTLQAAAQSLGAGKITCELIAGYPLLSFEFEDHATAAPRPVTPLPAPSNPHPRTAQRAGRGGVGFRRDWRRAG